MQKRTDTRAVATSSFRVELEGLGLDRILLAAGQSSLDDARRALARVPLSLEDAAMLLAAPREEIIDDLVERADTVTREVFGREVLLYAPCYLSSFCVNHCRYCGFNFTQPIKRRWLSPPRALEEIRHLEKRGFRRILLVSGESPAIVSPEYIEEVLREARDLGAEVDLEVAPAPEADYLRWFRAGAAGVVCYQETYDPKPYAHLHPRGPKRRFEYRLATLERAARAGMRRLGLGILVGLAEPRRDILAMIAHARYLARIHPGTHITASLPRPCPAVPEFKPDFRVDDEEMVRMFAVLRLALPGCGLVATTREPEWLRMRLLRAGITQMSAESLTVPGAYVECAHDGGQFEVLDHRTVDEVKWDLEDHGYTIRWTEGNRQLSLRP